MKLALICGATKMTMRQEYFKKLAWPRQVHWLSFWRTLQASALKPWFTTTVHITLGLSSTNFGYYQCVRVNMPCLLYTSRFHIGATSRKLTISYLLETLHISYFWGVRLIQFLSNYQIFQIESWLLEDGVSGYLEIPYRDLRYRLEASHFIAKCDNRGATITLIWSTDGFIFGGFSG